jgi:hypothetical protein
MGCPYFFLDIHLRPASLLSPDNFLDIHKPSTAGGRGMSNTETTTWPSLAIGLYDKLMGRGGEIT